MAVSNISVGNEEANPSCSCFQYTIIPQHLCNWSFDCKIMICSPKNGSDNNMVNFVVTRVSKTHFYSNTVLLLYSQHSKQHRWSSYACFSRMEHQRRERAGRHESRPAQSVTHQSHSARLGRFSHRNATAEISCIISWLIRRDFVAELTLMSEDLRTS